MKYSEKLKDPRWQKKRLEILSRDEFTCQYCQSKDKSLSVHHLEYEQGKNPWDYDNEYLVTLCQECHEKEELLKKTMSHGIVYLNSLGFLYLDIADIIQKISHGVDNLNGKDRIDYIKSIKSLIINE